MHAVNKFFYSGLNEDNIEWSNAHVWLDEKGREIVNIPGDGLCFLRSLQHTLGVVFKEKYSIGSMITKIKDEVKKRPAFYQQFLIDAAEPEDVIEELQTFFDTHFFSTEVVDLLVGIAVNVFRITLWIFQEDDDGMCQTIKYCTPDEESRRRHVHMILYRDKNDLRGLGNHYNTIIKKSINKGRKYNDFGQEGQNPEFVDTDSSTRQRTELSDISPSSSTIISQHESSSPTTGPSTQGNIDTPDGSVSDCDDNNISQQDFSNEPDYSKYNLRSEEVRVIFPEEIFSGVQPEKVTCVPYNINGNHSYKIHVTKNKWNKHQEDGRWFLMHTSTMRKQRIVRKTGKCLGSYVCRNDNCPKYTSGKGRNTYAFTAIGFNLFECKTCGQIAERDFCGAMKLTKFDPETKVLEVFYAGTHTCDLKVRAPYTAMSRKAKKEVIKPILQKNPKATVKEISESAAEHFLRIGNPDMAKEAVRMAQDRRFVAEMKEEVLKLVSDKDPNSFKAIGDLRDKVKGFDPFLIYKINDGSFNDEISYVFKTSQCAAQLALEMDCDDPQNKSCLREEPVYCDTMHSRVDKYKNVTAWVKNPITRSVMRIATMEVEHEDTHSLELFFNLLNEVLQKVSGQPRYKFNPYKFYVDEAGANINAISRVFGKKGLGTILGCQWHFLKAAQAKAHFVKVRQRKSFIHLARRLIKAPTRHEFEEVSRRLRNICEENNLLDWFLWWDERRFHIVPAYRGFNLSGTNLAESGQSGMKPKTRKKFKLVDAAYKDVAQMMRQDEQYRAYIGNISKEIGKGLNIRQIQERERKAQEERAKKYGEALLYGDINALTDDENDDDLPFCPTDNARHKPPRIYNKKNPTQRKELGRKGKGKGKGKSRRNYYEINSSDSDASSIHDDEIEDVPDFIDAEYVDSVAATKLISLNNAVQVKKCYTCNHLFDREHMVAPYDMVFTRKTKRLRPDGKGGYTRGPKATPAFFCARDIACLEFEFPSVQKKDIYMGNLTVHSLTRSHKKWLKIKGYWEPILHNRRLRASFR